MIQKDMLKIILIFVLFIQMQYNVQSLKNSRHGSYFGNEYGGFCIAAIEHPSPGFYTMEIWKDIEGYEGLYQVSSHGRIKSIDRIVNCNNKYYSKLNGRILILRFWSDTSSLYLKVSISKNAIVKLCTVHRLVAKAFIPNPENKREVNHKDGVKENNHVDNLEWCTASENVAHARNMGLMKKMEGNIYGAKLNGFQVRVIRKINDLSPEELANIFQISSCTIYDIKRNRTWRRI